MELVVSRQLKAPAPDLNPVDDPRAEIIVQTGRIDETCDAAEAALIASKEPYYVRAGGLVRWAERGRSKDGESTPLLVIATQAMLLESFERAVVFRANKLRRDGTYDLVPVGCPQALPAVYLSRIGRHKFPDVSGVSGVPVLHEDGSICWSGYDPRTKVVVCAPGKWPKIPERPTREQALAALVPLEALIEGFPFAEGTDRSVALAGMLSAVLRPSLPTCPGFAYTATTRGSGKSKLAEVDAVLATGRPPAALAWTAKDEENEKRLVGAQLSGVPAICLDNLEVQLRGTALTSAISQGEVFVRALGSSTMCSIETRALILVTGNNLVIQGDLNRRFLVCRIDPEVERPELRRFAFDPVIWAAEHRIELVSALLTIARWGAGESHDAAPIGSFEVWSRRVRDPLLALGLPDPCACLDVLHREDPEREAAAELLREWRRVFGQHPTTVAESIRAASRDDALRDALDAVAGAPGGLSAKRVGRYLLRIRGRLFGEFVVRQHRDLAGNCASWAVESCKP
jgi:putative DNA primase/helicase